MGNKQTVDCPSVVLTSLDAAGKTTFIYRLARDLGTEVVTTVPTIGFSVETLEVKNQKWTVWDVGTGAKIRPLYWHYYSTADAFTFMVDASDVERFEDNKQELLRLHYDLNKTDRNFDCWTAPLLILFNKQDLPRCLDSATLFDRLGINEITGRPVLMQPSSNLTGEGLIPGLRWLVAAVRQRIPKEQYDAKAKLWRLHDIDGRLMDLPGFKYPLETIGNEVSSTKPAASVLNAPPPAAAAAAGQDSSSSVGFLHRIVSRFSSAKGAGSAGGTGSAGAAGAGAAAAGDSKTERKS